MIRVVVICGPTGVGKTATAIKLAREIKGEIVGADSLQIYRYLDIGTAKPTPEERALVPHHLIDILEPHQPFDAAKFVHLADKAISEIVSRDRTPLVVGGTGLYIKALIYGLAPLSGKVGPVRERLKEELREKGREVLYRRLQSIDPQAAARISPGDTVRLLRALEIYELTGEPASRIWERHRFARPRYQALKIGLTLPRPILYARIEERTRQMFAQGLIEEVKGLLSRGFSPDIKPLKAIGYRQVVAYLEGKLTLEEAVAEVVKETKRYAKRQLTWFRADKEIFWFSPQETEKIIELTRRFLAQR